jgi:hypothetical protein
MIFFTCFCPARGGSLAAGALIAYVMRYDPKNTLLMTFSRWRPYLLLVCLPIIGAAIYFNNIVLWNAAFLFEPMMAACLVTLAIEGQRDWRTDWLANPIATYIGPAARRTHQRVFTFLDLALMKLTGKVFYRQVAKSNVTPPASRPSGRTRNHLTVVTVI